MTQDLFTDVLLPFGGGIVLQLDLTSNEWVAGLFPQLIGAGGHARSHFGVPSSTLRRS